jgi:hypothetical protein
MAPRHNPRESVVNVQEIPTGDLAVGMQIVEKVNGKWRNATRVTTIGGNLRCRGVHVNNRECYGREAMVFVRT